MKEDRIFLNHIIKFIGDIEKYIKGISKNSFFSDEKIQDAVFRKLELIGEASKNVSETLKSKYKKIEWKSIAGFRDKLIHHYFGIDLDLVWVAIKTDLPFLKTQMQKILNEK